MNAKGSDIQYWTMRPKDALSHFRSALSGLTSVEASNRQVQRKGKHRSAFTKDLLLLVSQFKSPIIFLLLFALIFSFFLKELTESAIIFTILLLSGLLGFMQERKAGRAAEKLQALMQSTARVKRDGREMNVAVDQVVRGDIVLLEAGDIVPADGLIMELKDLYVNESVLTGESFPSEKGMAGVEADAALMERKNSVFKGTSVISGTATILAVNTGSESELGKIESDLRAISEETAFERGIRQFGYLLMRTALVLAGVIIIINIWLGKNPLDSVLFALALAVGLTPEMLPAIVTITLSAGARRMAGNQVIVKKLTSIQNLGAIDVLCADKTGTLTEGEARVHAYLSPEGKNSDVVAKYAFLNAHFESGYPNPLDEAIKKQSACDISGYEKFDEVPYDFIRKRLSIVVSHSGKHVMISKGALKNIVEVCEQVDTGNEEKIPMNEFREKLHAEFESFSAKGFRTIGLCYKDVTDDPVINKEDETAMIFLGFILLQDPPKKGITEVIKELKEKQVTLKIITGDNTLIAENIASQLGIAADRIISGKELHETDDHAILSKVDDIDIFSETEPSQKERIVRALQKKGHVVGYLGDGINDAPALKAADVGISVNNAVDVAKESADIILLEKDLHVMSLGISEGRKTYLNTLKYIFITVSANFGNMFSMAGAALFLPFLPLLPSQILLTNFLTDIPALSISSDEVDAELLSRPRKWDMKMIGKFMTVFGLESSLFDFMTFAAMIWIFHATGNNFRTGWFIESVITEILILIVIRTRRSFFRSHIGKALLLSSFLVILTVIVLPYFPASGIIGLVPLPLNMMSAICLIALLYGITGEVTKKILFRKMNY